MSRFKSMVRRRHRHSTSSRRYLTTTLLAASTPALLAFLVSTSSASAASSPASIRSVVGPHDVRLPNANDAITDSRSQEVNLAHSTDTQLASSSQSGSPDDLNRRKHVAFQYADQESSSSDSDLLQLESPSLHDTKAPLLQYDPELDTLLPVDPNVSPSLQPKPHSSPLKEGYRSNSYRTSSSVNPYNDDLVGKQTGRGYVFIRHEDPHLYISGAGAAWSTLFSRRDTPVSRPPLVPNSNSRLLIGLVIVCILAVGVLTLAVQELYNRLRSVGQPRSPLRRRSGEGRPTRTFYRSDSSYTSIPSSHLAAPSLEEEEERIKTPPTLSRRSSAAASTLAQSPNNENASDSGDDDGERKTQADLHYLSLPFGIGIGYSYANIADGGDARTRFSKFAARRLRQRQNAHKDPNSTLALSTGTLPVPGTSGINGTDGLRSRSRSFRELCRDAMNGATTRDISIISEEDDDSDMTAVSTPRWGTNLVSLDLSGSERGSGTVTPTGLTGPSTLTTPTSSSIALDDLASHGPSSQLAKGRYFGVDASSSASATAAGAGAAASGGHTLIDLGLGTPELAISDPDGITRPASTPGVMPSQVARHPQVEQLRREGRSETGKRVGKGTPTNAKLH